MKQAQAQKVLVVDDERMLRESICTLLDLYGFKAMGAENGIQAKQLIHEFNAAAKSLESGDTHKSLALLGRIRTILKVCVTQVDILETMTPLQFNAFRGYYHHLADFNLHSLEKSRHY